MGGLHIHIHMHLDDETKGTLNQILQKINEMADKFDPLVAEVTEIGNVVDSTITLINNLATQLEDAKDDPVQIQALADSLKAKKGALAEAVAANTPGATTPA